MQEGQLLMTQAERDRLVALKKATKKLIRQREAAEELGLSIRQVQRLLAGLKQRGNQAVVHVCGGERQTERWKTASSARRSQRRLCEQLIPKRQPAEHPARS
jgi:hypothetical protein